MKSILVAIFVVGMAASPLLRYQNQYVISNDCPDILRSGEWCSMRLLSDREPFEVFVGNVHIINSSALCPWWIDPELWWNQSCTGGLPPRLPVPEGLR